MFKRSITIIKKMAGLSLIELLIALTISILVLSCLTAIILAIEKNYQTQLALNSIQENARIATNLFNSEIHQAGNLGCAKLTENFPFKNNSSQLFSKIILYHNNKMKPGTQGFTIAHADINHVNLSTSMPNTLALYVPTTEEFLQNEIAVLSDSSSVDIFLIAEIDKVANNLQKITSRTLLIKKYQSDAELAHLVKNSYFIEKTDRKSSRNSPVYALFVKDINGVKHELIDGVDDMKIHFAIVADNTLIEKNAEDVPENALIRGVSIKLVLSSVSKVYLQKNYYFYVALR